ncbi:unnamed protein product, partial [Discosporangium mesarthrocarpum]
MVDLKDEVRSLRCQLDASIARQRWQSGQLTKLKMLSKSQTALLRVHTTKSIGARDALAEDMLAHMTRLEDAIGLEGLTALTDHGSVQSRDTVSDSPLGNSGIPSSDAFKMRLELLSSGTKGVDMSDEVLQ